MPTSTAPAPARTGDRDRSRSGGQVVVIFAGAMLLFVLLAATVIDLSWYWTNNLRMQRAADAAALAGVVFLPGDTTNAYAVARAEAAKNGYASPDYTITPLQDPTNDRRLKVNISGPVGTYFARVVGINSWPASRDAKADFVLPVPMGSPENYYGVGYLIKPVTTTTTGNPTDSGWQTPDDDVSGGQWANPEDVDSEDDAYASADANGLVNQWDDFELATSSAGSPIPNPGTGQVIDILGLELRLTDAFVAPACASTRIDAEVSWDDGASWSSVVGSPDLGTNTSNGDYTLPSSGGDTSTAAWGGHGWTRNDFTDADFRVRLTAIGACAGASTINLDRLETRVHYRIITTTTTLQQQNVSGPGGQALIPQKFWGAMQSQGAPSIQGDAYMTKYETRKSTGNGIDATNPDANYAWQDYYNYAVEIPSGASNGSIWVYDAGFCDATTSAGTGESWTVGGTNGNSTRQPVSAYFDVYDTKETLTNSTDDTLVTGTGSTYRRLLYEDHVVYGAFTPPRRTNVGDCSSQGWHFGWTQIASGLGAGTYRIHSFSTDATSLGDQDDSTALNAFAFFADASGGTPRVYGLGAMEAYIRLPEGQASEFYLAQIEAAHAGKTMIINLWDPGDTGALSANLQILEPTGSGFTPASFDYQGTVGTTAGAASNCNSRSGNGVTTVTTNTGGASLFNGCWLTIEIALPTTYSAPTDPVSGEDGWWKIRYTMGSGAGNFSTDLTTWQVNIRGNPVHLVLP